jgi:hypothetical protein
MLSGVFLGVVVVLGVFVAAALMFVSSRRTPGLVFPYQKEPTLFSPAERSFLGVLEQAVGDQYRVMGKVRLADVIKVQSGMNGRDRQSAFNRIQGKHVDFVVCKAQDLAIQCVVELDDQSHNMAKRQGRDEFVDKALHAARVPVYHIRARRSYAAHEIQELLSALDPSAHTEGVSK